ncbi:unnamed protein product [Amoebophrya sp. A120]|nr:unnamed protein product [Amoebophrya sp. A120]|eukprot:GSA120T00005694001.1
MSASGSASGVLNADQQSTVDSAKVAQQMKNEKYLREHPEIQDLLGKFVNAALHEKPDDVLKFAGHFFTNPTLKQEVEAGKSSAST